MANVTVTTSQPNVTVNASTQTVNVSTTTSNIIVSNVATISNADIRGSLSVVDTGGDGSLSYANTTGVFTYTGPSAAEVRAHLSNTSPVNYDTSTGVISIDESALFSGKTTDDLAEGSTNLYYTNARVQAYVVDAGLDFNAEKVDDRVANLMVAGANLSYTYDDGANTLTLDQSLTTTDIVEGDNLYFTTPRARATLSASTSGIGQLTYNSTSGAITYQGPSSTDIRALFSASGGITYNSGTGNFELTDQGYISGVTAGDGLTGGGTSGNVTLNVVGGTGITADPDEISIDFTEFTTDNVVQGSTNLYYSNSLVAANLAALTSNIDSSAWIIGKHEVDHFVQSVNDLGTVSGDLTINCNDGGTVLANINADITGISLTNVRPGTSLSIVIRQDGVGNRDLDLTTTPSNWSGWEFTSDYKQLSTGPSDADIMTVYYDGTNYFASIVPFDAPDSLTLTGNITAGGMTINGEATVTGNLQVQGNIDYVNVVDLLVNDQSITLNYGNVAQDAQIIVDRTGATGSNVDLKWNESTDRWQFTNDGSTYFDLPTSTSDIAEGTNLYYTQSRFNTAFGNKTTSDLSEGTNLYYTDARFDTRLATKDTDDISEGSTNLYYTQSRFDTAFTAKDTDNLSEGTTNLYFTDARADARVNLQTGTNLDLSSKDTDDLSEGTTNLYYTDARSRAAVSTTTASASGGGSLAYDSGTGVFTFAPADLSAKIELTDLSITTATPSGDGALAYDNTTGVFTFTPADAGESDYGNVQVADFLANGFGSNTITTTGNITTTGFFEGDLDGAVTVDVYNDTGVALTKGQAVYLTGSNTGVNPHVAPADSDDVTKMPALGLVHEQIAHTAVGQVVTSGVTNFNSHGFTVGADVYIDTTAGGLTTTVPTGEDKLIQKIGKVVNTNQILVQGAFRTNATPNLNDGNIFVGDTNNQAVAADLNNFTYEIKSSANIETTSNAIANVSVLRKEEATTVYYERSSITDFYQGNFFGQNADDIVIDVGGGGNIFSQFNNVPFQISFENTTFGGSANLNGNVMYIGGSDYSGQGSTFQLFTDASASTPAKASELGITFTNGSGGLDGNIISVYAGGITDFTTTRDGTGKYKITEPFYNSSFLTYDPSPAHVAANVLGDGGGAVTFDSDVRIPGLDITKSVTTFNANSEKYANSTTTPNFTQSYDGYAFTQVAQNAPTGLNQETGFSAKQASDDANTVFSVPRFAMTKYPQANFSAFNNPTNLNAVSSAMADGAFTGVIDSKVNRLRDYVLTSDPTVVVQNGAALHSVGSILFKTADSNTAVLSQGTLGGGAYKTNSFISQGQITFRTMQANVAANIDSAFPYNTGTDDANSTVAFIDDKFNIGNEEDSTKAYSFPKLPGANNTVLVMDTNNDLQFEDFEAKMDDHFENLLRKYIGTINFINPEPGGAKLYSQNYIDIHGGFANTSVFDRTIDGGNA